MKVFKIILSCAAMVVLALMLNGCEAEEKKDGELGFIEAEKKKAGERGLAPKRMVDGARKRIADVEDKMRDRLNQVE